MACGFSAGTNLLTSVSTFTPPASASTVMFWANMNTLVPALQRFWGNAGNYEARVSSAGIVTNDLYNNSSGASSTSALAVGTWAHIACRGRIDGVPNSITDIFFNGVLDGGPTTVAGAAAVTATMTLGLRTGAGAAQGLEGILDDWRVYDRELSAAEIQTIHICRGTDNILEGLVARVMFTEGAPGTSPAGAGSVKDLSSAPNNYSPSGSPVFRPSELRARRKVA